MGSGRHHRPVRHRPQVAHTRGDDIIQALVFQGTDWLTGPLRGPAREDCNPFSIEPSPGALEARR
jgi:hypothetical protein